METDPTWLLAVSARLCCAGVMIHSFELWTLRREFGPDRLLGRAAVLRSHVGFVRRAFQVLDHGSVVTVLLLLRLGLAGFACVGKYGTSASAVALGGLMLLQLVTNRRFGAIVSNADTMFLIVLAGVFVGSLGTFLPGATRLAVAFVAAQSLIAYGSTGVSKLLSPSWHNGSRLLQLFADSSYHVPRLARWMEQRPRSVRLISWLVAGGEAALPVALLLPPESFAVVLVLGAAFHVTVALTMGLHGFFWAFTATYPALWWVHEWLHSFFTG